MRRRGVTLIELLIALAITMIMMGSVVTLFANMTTSVTDSRALIGVSERLRFARDTLQSDLGGHTAPAKPPISPAADAGFIELIEGLTNFDFGMVVPSVAAFPHVQLYSGGTSAPPPYPSGNALLGDIDDIIHMTVRSTGKPFTGYLNGPIAESQTAEVIWFCLPNGRLLINADGTTTQLCTLYRRVLLVLPGYKVPAGQTVAGGAMYANYDLSARTLPSSDPVAPGATIANTLGDLTKRENRFFHGTPGSNVPANFPFQLNNNPVFMAANMILKNNRLGEDVVLDNVLAFDVRVFDPLAQVLPEVAPPTIPTALLTPSDLYFPIKTQNDPSTVGLVGGTIGAYVDMGYINMSRSVVYHNFSHFGNAKTCGGVGFSLLYPLAGLAYPCATFDTWSTHYDSNGYDEDGVGGIDQGVNGLDDPGTGLPVNGVVDDPPIADKTMATGVTSPGESETMAPFPYPLRGMQVTLRVYEPDSRQVRQVTVTQSFVPE